MISNLEGRYWSLFGPDILDHEVPLPAGVRPLIADPHAIAETYRRTGLYPITDVVALPIPPQRGQDREWRSTRPGFEMLRHSSSVSAISNFVSSRVPVSENRYVGANQTRYVSQDFDTLVERFESTIPWSARMDALRGVVGHMTENVVTMPIFYDVGTTLVANRVTGVAKGIIVTDVERWDLRGGWGLGVGG